MRLKIIILTLVSTYCYSQQNYDKLLSVRLKEIEKLSIFNNSVVFFEKSSGYGSTYPFWELDVDYYQDDIVKNKEGNFYLSLVDNNGKNPSMSPKEWQFMPYTHPYFFLRDTAKVEDLNKLLSHEHPYIRTYAFGALAHRKPDGLFKILTDNLGDTTRILQMTSDFGYEVCPADLMVMYLLSDLTTEQKKILRH